MINNTVIIIVIVSIISIASVRLYSDRMSGRNTDKHVFAIGTALAVLASAIVATYVDFIYYGEFALWRFSLNAYSTFNIIFGMAAICAMLKMHRDL